MNTCCECQLCNACLLYYQARLQERLGGIEEDLNSTRIPTLCIKLLTLNSKKYAGLPLPLLPGEVEQDGAGLGLLPLLVGAPERADREQLATALSAFLRNQTPTNNVGPGVAARLLVGTRERYIFKVNLT